MPKVSDVFKPAFLRAGELNGASALAYLNGGYREEIVYGNSAYVLDVEVAGIQRALRFGTMLANDIAAALGDDEMNNWAGRAVTLYPFKQKIRDKDSGEDKIVDMIRAAAAPEGTPTRTMALSPRSTLNDDPDSIPF